MGFSGFGCNADDNGSLDELDRQLSALADAGFSHAELNPHQWDVWVAGRVAGKALARWETVVDRHRGRLRYTLHGPFDGNLFDLEDRASHERLYRGGLEVAQALGAEVVVQHPGYRLTPPAGITTGMLDLMTRERETLAEYGEIAARWGGRLALETWLAIGVPGYSYAVWPEQLAWQVEQIDHPAVGVCLDFGHLFASAHWYGFDFLAGVRRLAPLTNHFHVQDKTGIQSEPQAYPTLGRGDLHLPPGWGDIPFETIFGAIDFPRHPIFMVEIWSRRFLPYLDSILDDCRRLARPRGEVAAAG